MCCRKIEKSLEMLRFLQREQNTNMNKRKHLAQYIAGTGGNPYVEVTIPDGQTLQTWPAIQATLNSHIAGTYILSARRVSETVIEVYFNQAFTSAAILAVDYTIV